MLDTAQDVDEAIFLGLQIAGGQILLPILLFTVLLSPTVKRHPVFASFCISWICSSIAFSLLYVLALLYDHSYRLCIYWHRLYKGRSSDDDLSLDPTYDECLVQASLVNGVQAWCVHFFLDVVFDCHAKDIHRTVCTTFVLILHVSSAVCYNMLKLKPTSVLDNPARGHQ